jgi:DNA-binding CsgD family transcriptional regulator
MSYGFTRDILLDLHYGKNLTTNEIAKIYGCNRDTVRLAMKRFGIEPRGKIRKPMSEDLKSNLIILYLEQRLSTREIGKILGHSHDYVSDKLKELGIPVDDRITALQSERNPDWKGGITIENGYKRISSKAISEKRKSIHQIVMENYIGRELQKGEVVHHIDGNKQNNNINNLALMDISAHSRLHSIERWKNKC